jgi:hypothetical protein
MVLASVAALGVAAHSTVPAAAGAVTVNSVRIGGPSISTYANSIGGGIGAHTDRAWGHPDGGGTTSQGSCARRTGQRLDKRERRRNCPTDY